MKSQFLIIASVLATINSQYITEPVAAPVPAGGYQVAGAPQPSTYQAQPTAPPPQGYVAAPVPAVVPHRPRGVGHVDAQPPAPKPVPKPVPTVNVPALQKELDGICNTLSGLENQVPALIKNFKPADAPKLEHLLAQILPLETKYRTEFAKLPKGARAMRSWTLINQLKAFVANLHKPAAKPPVPAGYTTAKPPVPAGYSTA